MAERADAVTEFLVRLALDDEFRAAFKNTPAAQKEAFLREHLTTFDALDRTMKDALVQSDVAAINEHAFNNQQTSRTAAGAIGKALDAFLETLEAETKKRQ